MITLFTTCKPFEEPFDVIQRNAIKSWLLVKDAEIIICDSGENGVQEFADHHGIRTIPVTIPEGHSTPMVSDIFDKGQSEAAYDLMAYINADIVIHPEKFYEYATLMDREYEQFLMIGQRTNADIDYEIDFDSAWWDELRRHKVGLYHATAIDYFVFKRGLFTDIPPFYQARTAWDNWLVWKALDSGVEVVNATNVMEVYHHQHPYQYSKNGPLVSRKEVNNVDGIHNRSLLTSRFDHGVMNATRTL